MNTSAALLGGLVHVDHPRFQELFTQHPNVKACLSGHLHVVERIDFGGVTDFLRPVPTWVCSASEAQAASPAVRPADMPPCMEPAAITG